MRIDHLSLKNFRGFESFEVALNPHFSLIVGENGSGKSSVLEAVTVAMGAFLLGIKDIPNNDKRHIEPEEIHLRKTSFSIERQYPVFVKAKGEVNNAQIEWGRDLKEESGRTNTSSAKKIKVVASSLDAEIRKGSSKALPVLVYYSTGRLWKDFVERARKRDGEMEEEPDMKREVPSRFRGYRNCLQATSAFRLFLKWYHGKEIAALQKTGTDDVLQAVKTAVTRALPGCKNIYYELDPDREQTLMIEFEDGRTLPFGVLSDGTRNILALVADLAYRCVTLNPQFGAEATLKTAGIVVIDELDLHLHPEWQKRIVMVLREIFPKVQFVASSHSPFLIQEMSAGELIKLQGWQAIVGGAEQMSIEDIAEEIQGLKNPQWSRKKQVVFDKAEAYYKALQNDDNSNLAQLQSEFVEASKPLSNNPALQAILEQERLVAEARNAKSNA